MEVLKINTFSSTCGTLGPQWTQIVHQINNTLPQLVLQELGKILRFLSFSFSDLFGSSVIFPKFLQEFWPIPWSDLKKFFGLLVCLLRSPPIFQLWPPWLSFSTLHGAVQIPWTPHPPPLWLFFISNSFGLCRQLLQLSGFCPPERETLLPPESVPPEVGLCLQLCLIVSHRDGSSSSSSSSSLWGNHLSPGQRYSWKLVRILDGQGMSIIHAGCLIHWLW